MARPKVVFRPLKQRILEVDSMNHRAKEAEPNFRVGLANPANGGPNDQGPGTDLINGEATPYPKQTHRDEGSSRTSRARNWKRRARETNEQQPIATGKGDVRKRRAEDREWDETSDAQEGTKKRQRVEEAQEGSFVYSEVEAKENQGWNVNVQEGSMIR
ncbi:hypothetical protein U1Q18_013578 [Sarracenia purpurea var. burkii]